MSGLRLIVGVIVMGIAVPLMLFFLLGLHTPGEFFTVAATTFLSWGCADFLASILERPRLENRSPGMALREDLDRRRADE
ncbi:MAG: hypothetical protein QOK37_2825 [Thermoanaerobaculia bacterium]|jgi:hypothetical protein|nr:hypothetical protein [Thermoanaerobaculia bacterium]